MHIGTLWCFHTLGTVGSVIGRWPAVRLHPSCTGLPRGTDWNNIFDGDFLEKNERKGNLTLLCVCVCVRVRVCVFRQWF